MDVTTARTREYVPYDAFLHNESADDEKHEWVDGIVYAMSRVTPEHARLAHRFAVRVLGQFLEEGCEGFAFDAALFIEAAQHHTYANGILVCGPLVTRRVHDKNGKSIGEVPDLERRLIVAKELPHPLAEKRRSSRQRHAPR